MSAPASAFGMAIAGVACPPAHASGNPIPVPTAPRLPAPDAMVLPAQTALLRLLIVAAALCGALVVTHLKLQESNGFANGCSGLATAAVTYDPTAPAETSGCAEVTQGPYSTILGVSNIVWGFVFYALIVGLRLAYSVTASDRLRAASFAASAVGVAFAAYFVYVMFGVIGHVCALCLTSHAFTLLLFAMHLAEARRVRGPAASPTRAAAPRSVGAALRPYAPLLGLFALLAVADIAWAGRSGAPAQTATPGATPGALPPATSPTAALTGTTPPAGETCGFDPNIAPIADLAQLTSGPYEGSADAAAVPVIEIFDPNCPHCRDLGEVLAPILAAEAGRVRFYLIPYPLRNESVAQVMALKASQPEGKYLPLVAEMFRRQDQNWGMLLPELVQTLDAVGMDGAAFQARLQDQAALAPLLAQVQADASAVADAFKSRDGGISTPRVAVGNRVVLGTSFTPDCMARLIGEAAAAR